MATFYEKQRAIFEAACALPTPAERAVFLEQKCGGDNLLRQRIDALLRAHQDPRLTASPLQNVLAPADMLASAMRDRIGEFVGPYQLKECIGEGGMGIVFVAEQTRPVQRLVALKIIKPGMDSGQVIARFEAERQTLAMMSHPNIARIFDGGTADDGRPYFAMELVIGMPITRYCEEECAALRERLALFIEVCSAVHHAHQKGIIHRDLKPSNVLVTRSDGTAVPKVIDFGIAKALGEQLPGGLHSTSVGQTVGTPMYMSPEQARFSVREHDIDTRSDIYSLGVLLYELLVGTTPFDLKMSSKPSLDEHLRIVREVDPPRPSSRINALDASDRAMLSQRRRLTPRQLVSELSGELDWIVMKSLEKDRTRRYESARDLADDIRRYLEGERVQACPPSAAYRFRKFARNNIFGLTIAALTLVFLVLAGSGIGWFIRDREAREREIVHEREERQSQLAEKLKLIIAEVERLEARQQWSEALAAAQRAEALLADDAPADLSARLRTVVSDLVMVGKLEQIRLNMNSEMVEGRFMEANEILQRANQDYSEAFLHNGVDPDALPALEMAAWLRSRSPVLSALISHLDVWAYCRRELQDHVGARALTELAQAVDADTLRRRVREAFAEDSSQALQEIARSEDIARIDPTTAEVVAHELSRRSLRGSNLRELALAVLRRALHEHPDDFGLHVWTAIAIQYDSPDEAVRHFTAALALRPNTPAILTELGLSLRDLGRIDEAIACYQKSIALNPNDEFVHWNLGNSLAEDKGDFEQAAACYQRALRIDPDHTASHFSLGGVLSKLGKLDEALACFDKYLELRPKGANPSFYLANAYLAKASALNDHGRLSEAIDWYDKAIERRPNDADAHSGKGIALRKLQEFDAAIASFRKAIEIAPRVTDAHTNIAAALTLQGKTKEAVNQYEEVLRLFPDNSEALDGLAWLLANAADRALRQPTRAVELATKAVDQEPTEVNWRTLGSARYRNGDWRGAIAALEDSEKLAAGGNVKNWLFLAMAHCQVGEVEEARRWYGKSLEWLTMNAADEEVARIRIEADALLGGERPATGKGS